MFLNKKYKPKKISIKSRKTRRFAGKTRIAKRRIPKRSVRPRIRTKIKHTKKVKLIKVTF